MRIVKKVKNITITELIFEDIISNIMKSSKNYTYSISNIDLTESIIKIHVFNNAENYIVTIVPYDVSMFHTVNTETSVSNIGELYNIIHQIANKFKTVVNFIQ